MGGRTVPGEGGGSSAGGLVDGRYELRELLGSGGMAEVYLAYDVVLDRAVALKMMHGRYAATGTASGSAFGSAMDADLRREVVERFRREARAAAGLSHPSIVAVYDQGSLEDGAPYIAMEYVPGGTLKDGIRRYGAIPPRAAAETALQIADALDAAHARGMIHRDIKPQNILITASGDVKVTDFGIARAMADATASAAAGVVEETSLPGRPDRDGRIDLTATGVVMGTAGYISPEQAMGEPAGPQSDLYSLGVTLYEMLTGELPFRAETPLSTAVKHVAEPPRPPREVNPSVPASLDAVARRLLEKDPRRRYEHAGTLAADLQRILDEPPSSEGAPMAGSGPAVQPPVRARVPNRNDRRRKRGRPAAVVASLVLALGLGLAAYAWAYAPGGEMAGGGEPVRGVLGEVLDGIPGPVGDAEARPEPGTRSGTRSGTKPDPRPEPKAEPKAEAGAGRGAEAPSEVTVPDVVGMPLEEARGEGSPAEDLEIVEEGRVASEEPSGVIVEQRPSAARGPNGERATLEEGSELSVTVSEGRLRDVPDVVEETREEAGAAVEEAGLEARFREEESGAEDEGLATAQNPGPDGRAREGSAVTVTIGAGPAEVETPDVRGLTPEAARARLEGAGIALGEVERRQSDAAGASLGDVFAQDPAAGETVEAGTSVDVSVSSGPELVGVPDVVGLDVDAGKQAMLDAGLGYTAVEAPAGEAEVGFGARIGSVVSTDPGAGARLEPETYVKIFYVADLPQPTTTMGSAPPLASPPASSPPDSSGTSSSGAPTSDPPPETFAGRTPPITSEGDRRTGRRDGRGTERRRRGADD